ncbi:MAG: 5'/3'-nucleotidase SurE [Nitrososphaerales archaeon]|nr:5'/3'-nucleotidase SurE [Nitrososphaerales archaeon]
MARSKKLVMVTNDDSVQSNGIIDLARAIAKFADVTIVAPEQPQSATALSLTFHKPLRVSQVDREEFRAYAVSGSPGDCVMIGVNKLLPRLPDLVASGINIGDNNTFQDVLASGTVAAALEAALTGIPAIAFSMEVRSESLFALEYDQPDFKKAAEFAAEIVRDVLEHGMPNGAELLNVNFPSKVDSGTEIELTEVGRRKYTDKVLVRKDPHGRAYYWLFGERLSEFPENSDAEAVLIKRRVSITPLNLRMSGPITDGLRRMRERVEERLEGTRRRRFSKGK